ncbi:MAG TPA: DoxX family membrane protein [Actinomycetes bacterium]|nr:DoxX family membrane protein [Actinomycetes bacterium]
MARTAKAPVGVGVLPARVVAKGLAAFRIFMGFTLLTNGLAKVVNKSAYDFKIVSFGLIDRGVARGLLVVYAGPKSHAPAFMKSFYNSVVLDHWAFWQYFLTAAEVTGGVLLCIGLASRFGGLIGVGLIGPLLIMTIDNGAYLFDFLPDVVPFVILALVPSGRVWGLDGRMVARFGDRWPF